MKKLKKLLLNMDLKLWFDFYYYYYYFANIYNKFLNDNRKKKREAQPIQIIRDQCILELITVLVLLL